MGITTASLLLFAASYLSIGSVSLKVFSRRSLSDACSRNGHPSRFDTIVADGEKVGLACDWLVLLLRLGAVVILALWMFPQATPDAWLRTSLTGGGLVAGLVLTQAVLPWSVARVVGEGFLAAQWPVLTLAALAMHPMMRLAQRFDRFAHLLAGKAIQTVDNKAELTADIKTVIDAGQRGGALESATGTMIHRVIELQDVDADAVMTPRTDMVTLQVDADLQEARQCLLSAGHSRVPVTGKSTDDIVGILYAKDLLKYDCASAQVDLSEIVREPFYVPETTAIGALLETMKHKHVHMAIVLDEYGGVAGLVTMEDILEEIVGEIVDEYDTDEGEQIKRIDPLTTDVAARSHIDDLNRELEIGVPESSDYDTIGGFVVAQLGRIPTTDETFSWQNLRFQILEADKRRVTRVRIESMPVVTTPDEE